MGACRCACARYGVFQAGGRPVCGSVVSEGVWHLLVLRIPGSAVDWGNERGATRLRGKQTSDHEGLRACQGVWAFFKGTKKPLKNFRGVK